jgi:hypothetical protein
VIEQCESKNSFKNNDALAHVYLIHENSIQDIENRIYTEFVTDIGERLVDQPFYGSYRYDFDGKEVVYDTGLRLFESLQKSVLAAEQDVRSGFHDEYHLRRQEAFYQQGLELFKWLVDEHSSKHLMFISLCPDYQELRPEEATKQGFKPDRKMASIQLHSKTEGGYVSKTFSLDNLDIDGLNKIAHELYIDNISASSTIDLLSMPIYIDDNSSSDAVAADLINKHDQLLLERTGALHRQGINLNKNVVEANEFVAKHNETYELYLNIVYEVAHSLKNGLINYKLAHLIDDSLLKQYGDDRPKELVFKEGDLFYESNARLIVEYVRSRAIPEYLNSKLIINKSYQTNISTSYSDIGAAGVGAYTNGKEYNGSCPSSGIFGVNVSKSSALSAQAAFMQLIEVAYETPKPIMTKNGYNVIPIGSCPVCGAECGVGIQNIKTKKWHCVQTNCAAFDMDVYSMVFSNDKSVDTLQIQNNSNETIQNEKSEPIVNKIDLTSIYKELYWERWLANYNFQNSKDEIKKFEFKQRVDELDIQILELSSLITI